MSKPLKSQETDHAETCECETEIGRFGRACKSCRDAQARDWNFCVATTEGEFE